LANVSLTQKQIDWISEACVVAVDERACFLEEDVRLALAQALYAMNRPNEAALIEPKTE
jgi:hypothetical protein